MGFQIFIISVAKGVDLIDVEKKHCLLSVPKCPGPQITFSWVFDIFNYNVPLGQKIHYNEKFQDFDDEISPLYICFSVGERGLIKKIEGDFVMQTKLKYEIVLKRVKLFQDIDEEKRCQLFAFNICVRNISSFLLILRVTS